MSGLILSHQQCGSSALTRFLRQACNVRAGLELFNARMMSKRLPEWRSLPIEQIYEHVTNHMQDKAAMTHIYGQLPDHVDLTIFNHEAFSAIVFLYHEAPEAAALSSLVARKLPAGKDSADAGLGRIELDEVQEIADDITQKRLTAYRLAEVTDKPLHSFRHEDVYAPTQAASEDTLRGIIDALGLPPNGDFDAAFDAHIAPARAIEDTYRHIENIDELTDAFPHVL